METKGLCGVGSSVCLFSCLLYLQPTKLVACSLGLRGAEVYINN